MVDASNFEREEATAKFPGLSLSTVVFSAKPEAEKETFRNNKYNEIITHVQKENWQKQITHFSKVSFKLFISRKLDCCMANSG
jgi:outer membrane protein assembly factor BamD (BamD/ComL family)